MSICCCALCRLCSMWNGHENVELLLMLQECGIPDDLEADSPCPLIHSVQGLTSPLISTLPPACTWCLKRCSRVSWIDRWMTEDKFYFKTFTMLQVTVVTKIYKTTFQWRPTVYSDATNRFISIWQCIWEVKGWFYLCWDIHWSVHQLFRQMHTSVDIPTCNKPA